VLYQFLDWRQGGGRRLFNCSVEDCLARVRAANGGKLPLYLDTWEHIQAFAGAAAIPLPEMEEVARSLVTSTAGYPNVAWVAEQYAKFLVYIAQGENSGLLKDPEPVEDVIPLKFSTIMEKSTSNVADTGEPCSEPSPVTCFPTGTYPGSPSVLSTGKKLFPKVLQRSTPTLVPRHLCERLKAK
jgi:hypothetical protein